MKIPFFDIKRQYESIKDEVEPAILEVARSCGYVEGKAVKQFESNIAEYLGVKHAITCNSGTDALVIALKACGVGVGDEVITTSFSFFATAEAIGAVGAIPDMQSLQKIPRLSFLNLTTKSRSWNSLEILRSSSVKI